MGLTFCDYWFLFGGIKNLKITVYCLNHGGLYGKITKLQR